MTSSIACAVIIAAFSAPVWAQSARQLGSAAGMNVEEAAAFADRIKPVGHLNPDLFNDCHPQINAFWVQKPELPRAVEIVQACMAHLYGKNPPFGYAVEPARWLDITDDLVTFITGVRITIITSNPENGEIHAAVSALESSIAARRWSIALWPVKLEVSKVTPN